MSRIRTHYDNLKVARDAPIEVIHAAYRSLALKYHPDNHSGSEEAIRISKIINRSYGVLSNPATRLEHDRWIANAELDSVPVKKPPPFKIPTSISNGPIGKHLLLVAIVGIFAAMILFGVFFTGLPDKTTKASGIEQSQSRAVGEAGPVQQLTAIPPKDLGQPHAQYIRPALAPNGRPWPSVSGYLDGYELLNTDGRSSVTVDNERNNSDVFVKLKDRMFQPPRAVRMLFLRAHEKFTMMSTKAGSYDIRYKDLSSGVVRRSEPFSLQEINESDGIRYSDFTLTLYTVFNGNTHSEIISEAEF